MNKAPSDAQPLRLRVAYNANKFFKLPLRPWNTAVVATACPICGGPLAELISVETAQGEPVLVRGACVACGFVTFTRMPNQPWFEAFYHSDWDRGREAASIEQKIEAPYGALMELLLPQIPNPTARILEIGSGYGGALNSLKRNGFTDLRGIEASEKRWRVCREKLGLAVALTTAERMAEDPLIASDAPYDVVFSWHVIEHVVDLDRTIAAIARLLKLGGRFVIGVPHLDQEHLVYLAHYLPHIHSFTPESLTGLLHKHGLLVEHIDPSIRAVARKIDASAPAPATPGFRQLLLDKIRHDFDLARFNGGDGWNRDADICLGYRMAMFTPCTASAQRPDRSNGAQRTIYSLKRLCFGPGHNLQPMLHPRVQPANILDPANLLHWLAQRCLPVEEYEFGARIEVGAAASVVPQVALAYPGDHGFGWVK
jgi:SAM-dependent methyltransferase